MAALNIREIPQVLLAQLKWCAAFEGKTLKQYVIECLRAAMAESIKNEERRIRSKNIPTVSLEGNHETVNR